MQVMATRVKCPNEQSWATMQISAANSGPIPPNVHYTYRQVSKYKAHQIPTLKRFSYCLADSFAKLKPDVKSIMKV